MNISYLYKKLESLTYRDFFEVESDFFIYLTSISKDKSISYINTFLIVSNWMGTSERSGVWVFYESTNISMIQDAVSYLKAQEDNELACMLEKGIHDYQNPIYFENFNYPDEWITESEQIDDWISDHTDWLRRWLYTFLMEKKEQIIAL